MKNTCYTHFHRIGVKLLSASLCGMMLVAVPAITLAQQSSQANISTHAPQKVTTVTLNGTPVDLKGGEFFYDDGELMVPVRPIAEALGYTVTWVKELPDQVALEKDHLKSALTIGSLQYLFQNDIILQGKHAPKEIEGRTYIPFEFLQWIAGEDGVKVSGSTLVINLDDVKKPSGVQTIHVNGTALQFYDLSVINEEETIWVPVIPVAQELGYEVKEEQEGKTIAIFKDGLKNQTAVGSAEYLIDNDMILIGKHQAKMVGNTFYVSIEFFQYLLGEENVAVDGTVLKLTTDNK